MTLINKGGYNLKIGGTIALIVVMTALVGMFWTPYDPAAMSAVNRFAPPSLAHLFGTDNFGRDILSRVMEGAGATFAISAATVFLSAAVGIIIGGLTGYFGGIVDSVLMRVNDTLAAFPSILLALVMISFMGPGKYNVIITLSILFVPSFARVSRGEFARLKGLDFVHSARIMGAGHARIIFRHMLPNTMPVLFGAVAIGFNNAVLAEASMSFLGIGVQPHEASLGRMLSESQGFLFTSPWYAFSVGCVIVLMILGFSMLGDGIGRLRDE